MKSYTDLVQSKKLVAILPIESADMGYNGIENRDSESIMYDETATTTPNMYSIPCWSLAALFEQIPYKLRDDDGNLMYLQINKEDNGYQLAYTDPYGDFGDTETNIYKDFVDACYEMILKLRENNLL